MLTLHPGFRVGTIEAPISKSHYHRLLVSDFLAGDYSRLGEEVEDSDDIKATKRCLRALSEDTRQPTLDCGESGSTLRFLAPVAAALGKQPNYLKAGRLAERPMKEYRTLESGVFEIEGNVSSQFVTGLLFALPLLKGDSRIVFKGSMESRGYVNLTLKVLAGAGIDIEEYVDGFKIGGSQHYRSQRNVKPEGDWSGAAFWFAMNRIGSNVKIEGLQDDSEQPDRAIVNILKTNPEVVDVSQCPDIFPVLTVVAAAQPRETRFVGIRRLRMKESDRVMAMNETLCQFGVGVDVSNESFVVHGIGAKFSGGEFRTFGDHRIAMSIAVGATIANSQVSIDDGECSAKSYPRFFEEFAALRT